MKNRYFLIIILFVTLNSCKTKKSNITDNSKVIVTNSENLKKVKFIPESKLLQFQLTKKEDMPFPAYDFGAELYNGKIYAFLDTYRNRYGKEDHNHGDVCVYDIEKNSWTKVNIIPKSQEATKSVLVGDKIYLIGGYGFKDLIQVYNINKNSWEESLKLPFGLYWCSAEVFNDKIYIIGGYAEDMEKKGVRFLSDVQILDTKTKTWSKGAEMPRKIQSPNSLKYNDQFYVWDCNPKVMFKYNIAKDMWVSVDELQPYVKGAQEGIVFNDKFIFISGQNTSGLQSKAVKKIYRYNPVLKIYEESYNNLLIGRHYNYGVFEYKSKIYILGGREDQEWEPMNAVIEIEIKP
jgi:N-acetylneuraminic acid mutarotase